MSEVRRCRWTPGDRFDTRKSADEAVLTRKVNAASNGGVDLGYQVKGCNCGGFHVMTAGQLAARRRKRGTNRR